LSLDRIRGAIPANGRLTKSRQQPAEPTCAYRDERASPDDTRELARDSAIRRAHSTDVRRTRHACAHFLLCRTRHGKLEFGQGCGRRGSANAAVCARSRPGTAPAVPRGSAFVLSSRAAAWAPMPERACRLHMRPRRRRRVSAAQPEGNELAGAASLLPAWRDTRPRWFANRLSATRRV
jgi:hypothetical protein